MKEKKRVISILLSVVFLGLNFNVNTVKAEKNNKATGYISGKEEQLFQKEDSKDYLSKSYNEKEYSKLPSRYNALDYNEVTGVRSQGSIGCCWAFSTYGAIEANLKKNTGEDYDFSEIHMADNNGIVKPNDGGDYYCAFAYLFSGKGPVLEKDSPYPSSGKVSDIDTNKNAKVYYRVNEMGYLYNYGSKADTDYIKKNILNYGALSCSIRITGPDYFTDDCKYLYNYDKDVLANHAVTIVGWDDNISKNKFARTPEGDGAFICKNSWGENQKDNGYFYVSYYDTQIRRQLTVYDDIERVSPYEKVISYSNLSSNNTENGHCSERKYYGTVFEADEDINLNSISINSSYKDLNCKVHVEEDYESNKFRNILNKENGRGSFKNSGSHNIKLDNPVKIKKGNKYFVCIESDEQILYSDNGDTKGTDNSYVRIDDEWKKASGCFPITIYTSKVLENEVKSISLDKASLDLNGGESCKLNINFNPSNTTDKTVNWKTSDNGVASVNEQGVVKAKRNGQAIITAYTELGNVKASCIVSVNNAFNISVINGYREGELLDKDKDLRIIFNDFMKEGNEKPYFIDEAENKYECDYDLNDNYIDIHIDCSRSYVGEKIKLIIPKNSFTNDLNQELEQGKEFCFKAPNRYIENIEFKDKNLEKIIRSRLEKENENISSYDMLKIDYLPIDDENVWSLSGLEYAYNLRNLSISNSNIYNLNPISNLNNIECIYIWKSNISSLEPLRNKDKLETLNIQDTRLSDCSAISTLKNLKYLNLSNTNIDNIEFLKEINSIEKLELNNNDIKDISILSKFTNLSEVDLNNNKIEDISSLLDACNNYDGKNPEDRKISIGRNMVNNSTDNEGRNIINKIKDLGVKVYCFDSKEKMSISYVNDGIDRYKNVNADINNTIKVEFSMQIPNKIEETSIYIQDSYGRRNINFDIIQEGNILYLTLKEKVDDSSNHAIYFDKNSIEGLAETIIIIKPYDKGRGDVNNDGNVDIDDLALAANDYNLSEKESDVWNINEDCAKDGIIDIYDIAIISKKIK